MTEFKNRLTELRKQNLLSQREMAQKLGISQPSYVRYENGTAQPNLDRLVMIADIFDVSLDYLVGREKY